jgi:hypothetical protein
MKRMDHLGAKPFPYSQVMAHPEQYNTPEE